MRHTQQILAASGGVNVITLVPSPSFRQVQPLLRSKWARLTAVTFTLFLVMPVAALAQNSPFDTGFTAIQSLFTGTIAKVASLVAIVIGGYGFAHGEPG
ncbi:MAG: TrbC/VirB2 family protein, partial [Terriglobales bacterium]